ncbi:hypothetical protein EVAR_78021_1 [Eumeta japonica]|uniref:Uncharacterized protein n=1 Tax=Eumeta variegata TaxID=151549 RepID=A0A4C1T310_EUMVA|nr:hypothetical protein EVAR_78021_1 [Eumeta japonica]
MARHIKAIVIVILSALSTTVKQVSSRRIWDTLAEGIVDRDIRETPLFASRFNSEKIHREPRENVNDVTDGHSITPPVDFDHEKNLAHDGPLKFSLEPVKNDEAIHDSVTISDNHKASSKSSHTEPMTSSSSSEILHTDIQRVPKIQEHLNKLARISLSHVQEDHGLPNHASVISSVFGDRGADTRNEKRRHLMLHFSNIFLKSLSHLFSNTQMMIQRALANKS